MRNFAIVFIVSLFGISGCATTSMQPASDEELAKINTVEVFISAPSQVLEYARDDSAMSSGGVAGGVIGALVGAAISSGLNKKWAENASQVMKPIQNYDYRHHFNSALKQRLENQGLSAEFNDIDADLFNDNKLASEFVSQTNADAVMVVTYSYFLERGYNIRGYAASRTYLKSRRDAQPTKEPEPAIVRVSQHLSSPHQRALNADIEAIVSDLVENNGERLQASLQNITSSLVFDLAKGFNPGGSKQ